MKPRCLVRTNNIVDSREVIVVLIFVDYLLFISLVGKYSSYSMIAVYEGGRLLAFKRKDGNFPKLLNVLDVTHRSFKPGFLK